MRNMAEIRHISCTPPKRGGVQKMSEQLTAEWPGDRTSRAVVMRGSPGCFPEFSGAIEPLGRDVEGCRIIRGSAGACFQRLDEQKQFVAAHFDPMPWRARWDAVGANFGHEWTSGLPKAA